LLPAQLRDFAERYTAAWCSQDAASVAAFFSPDGSLTINDGAPAAGRGAITAVAQEFMTTLPDLLLLMDDLRVRGDRVEYHWTCISAARGVRFSGYEEWRFGDDGLVAESRGHFDSVEYQRQLDRV
jgi:hypothetical protein